MEIVGLGSHIVECLRVRRLIDRHGEQFLLRVYTPRELRDCRGRSDAAERFAALWAAKEAVFRSLGTPWRKGMSGTHIEVQAEPGEVTVQLLGAARERMETRQVHQVLLTLAHCRAYATATAIAVRYPTPTAPKQS